MEFLILGPLVVLDGSQAVGVAGARLQSLLCLLLTRPGVTVSGERLAEELWGEHQPSAPANAVQSLISRLRAALGPAASLVETTPAGYRFAADPTSIDAVRFVSAVERARVALAADDLSGAARAFEAALALWRGAALDGVAAEGSLHDEAVRLDALRLDALEQRCDVALRLGRHMDLVTELGSLVAEHPVRERFHALYMLALYRSGRQAEALRAYRRARTELADVLGLEPGPELRSLEAAILAQDPSLRPDATPVGPHGSPGVLAAAGLSSFVGRVEELRALEATVDRHRLVTITGPGGVGKTRLALALCARRAPSDHVRFADLAAVGDRALVGTVVADAVGATDGRMAAAPSTAAATVELIARHVDDRRIVLLLDNCEHVVDEVARLVQQLLLACPRMSALATSREPLNIPGEHVWPIPPLALADAIELFVDRAAAAGSSSIGATDEQDLVDLCTRLDGLPLAIELAAGRTRVVPVPQLVARLDERFHLLTSGARTALPRHQTLRAVVDWSYDLLFDDERKVFERLSVFAGGCSLDAAELVCAGDDVAGHDVADLLFHLVDKSLVTSEVVAGEARFRLLQTLALYGRQRLTEAGRLEEARQRHCRYYAALCDRGQAAFRGDSQVAWLRDVVRETDNIRAALAWSIERDDAATAVAMAGGLGWSWWITGRTAEGCRWLDAALACHGEAEIAATALAKVWACVVGSFTESHIGSAGAQLEEAIRLWTASGDTIGLADATTLLADVQSSSGSKRQARQSYEVAAALYAARSEDAWCRARASLCEGRVAALDGDQAEADRCAKVWMAHVEAAGVTWALTMVRADTRAFPDARGDVAAAVAETKRALTAARQLGLNGPEPLLMARLGHLAVLAGDVGDAERRYAGALARAEELGSWPCVAVVLNGRAIGRKVAERLDEAAADAAEAARLNERAANPKGVILAHATSSFIAQRQQRWDDAVDFHSRCASRAIELGDEPSLALAVESRAGIEWQRGRHDQAARLVGAAHELRSASGAAPAGPDSDVDRISAQIRATLTEAAYADLFELGRSMPREEILHLLSAV